MKFVKLAIRTSYLRVDPHIMFPSKMELSDPLMIRNMVVDFLQAASRRGLDMIFIVSDWLYPGKIAKAIIKDKRIDILVYPAQELVSEEGVNLIAVNIETEIEQRHPIEYLLKLIYSQNGLAIILQPNKSDTKYINKISEEEWAPVGVILFNDNSNEFIDTDINPKYELLIASGAMNAQALLQTKSHTKTNLEMWSKYLPEIQFIYKDKKRKKEKLPEPGTSPEINLETNPEISPGI